MCKVDNIVRMKRHLRRLRTRAGTSRYVGRAILAYAAAVVVALALAACSSTDLTPPAAAPPALEVTRDVPPAVVKEVFASVRITEPDKSVGQLDRVVVSPVVVVADSGETVALSAQAYLEDGEIDTGAKLIWIVKDIRAGSINPDGKFTAGIIPGDYPNAISVTATNKTSVGVDQTSELISVTVVGENRPASIASIEVLPAGPAVFSGQLFRMRAIAYDENGFVIPGVSFDWRVNEASLGSVTASGYLNVQGSPGLFTGAVSVTARWQGQNLVEKIDVNVLEERPGPDDMTVQVLPQRVHIKFGDNMQLRAVALNGLGELVTGTQLRWSVDEPQAGSITGGGMFTAGVFPGVYTEAVKVEAIIPGESGVIHAADFASVIVRGDGATRKLDGVVGRPGNVVIGPGGRTILVARAFDPEGHPAENVGIHWEMTDDAAGTINENGSFKASSQPGSYPSSAKVVATQDADGEQIVRSDTVDVSITGLLTIAEISPVTSTVPQEQSVHFMAYGTDENGLLLPGLVVRWGLADETAGSIDAFGNFIATGEPGLYENLVIATVVQPLTD